MNSLAEIQKRSKNWHRKTEQDFESGLMPRMWKKPMSCSRLSTKVFVRQRLSALINRVEKHDWSGDHRWKS